MKFSDRLDELFYKDKKDRTKIETAIAKGYWSSMDIDTWNDALEELARLEKMRIEDKSRFDKWYASKYLDMVSIVAESRTDKIEYSNKNFGFEEKVAGLFDNGKNGLSWDVGNVDAIGISPTTMITEYENIKFGKVKEFVAEKLNAAFGTSFTAKDINYYEEGWYNG